MIFNELEFNVNESVFYELFKNPDKGFGFSAILLTKDLNSLQIEVFDFLSRCYDKKLLGMVKLNFKTDAVGEIDSVCRTVESVTKTKTGFIISNTY